MSSARPRPPRPGRTEFLPHLDQPSTRNRPRRSSGVRRLSGRSRMEHVRRRTRTERDDRTAVPNHGRERLRAAPNNQACPRSIPERRDGERVTAIVAGAAESDHAPSARDSEREVRHFQVAARVLRQRIVPARFRTVSAFTPPEVPGSGRATGPRLSGGSGSALEAPTNGDSQASASSDSRPSSSLIVANSEHGPRAGHALQCERAALVEADS